MNFTEIAENRQSCRNYDPEREAEQEKLIQILDSARLAPSACNGQPYQITVCKGEKAKAVAKAPKPDTSPDASESGVIESLTPVNVFL